MLVLLALLLFVAPTESAHGRTVRVAIPGFSYVIAFVAAQEQGYYREENLDVELVRMPVGVGVKALLAGNVEFAAMGSALFSAILGGASLRIIMSSFHRPLFFLYANPGLTRLQDLKGKTVGVPALGTAGHSMLVEILQRNGQLPDSDIALVGIGSTETRLQALLRGVIDAAVLSPPSTFLAEDAGFSQILSFVNQDLVFPGGGIGVSEQLLRTDSTHVENFARATLKGHHYVFANETGMIPLISKSLHMKKSHAEKYYRMMRGALTPDGTIDSKSQKQALAPALRLRGATESPPLQRIFDFSLLRKLNAELKAVRWKP